MLITITSKYQITLPAHILDTMGVGQATRFSSYQVPTVTSSGPDTSTTRA